MCVVLKENDLVEIDFGGKGYLGFSVIEIDSRFDSVDYLSGGDYIVVEYSGGSENYFGLEICLEVTKVGKIIFEARVINLEGRECVINKNDYVIVNKL